MDAIVLAGGYATRLWPLTKRLPKMFLPVGDETVIDTVLADLEEDDRVDDVYISTNELFARYFRAFVRKSDYDKPKISVEDTTAESEKFGVIGALAQLVDRENISEDTLVIAGDNLISFDVSEFIDFFEGKQTHALAAYDVGSTEKAKSYGLVELDGETVVDFQEKPEDPKSTLVSVACYAFPGDSLHLLDEYLDDGNNPDEPGWFIQWLHQQDEVNAFTFDGAWFDIGTAEGYLDAISWYLEGDNYVSESSTVENSDIGENVYVLPDAEIVDSSLSNTVVFSGAEISDSSLSQSVVCGESQVDGIDADSLILGPTASLGE